MAKDRIPADEVFNAARRLTDSDARRVYLDQACGEDGTLRARVDALLRAHDEGGDFLQSPVAGGGIGRALESIALPAPEGPGSMVGPYKVLQRIGEGGFGVVYMAEQQHPVRRKVALKLIKPGFDTRQVIARFEAERQALALMDHENIAKVLDAGATDSGRPYFVMELVHGVPITEFCDAIQLAPHRRLELFVQVCRAVQHAHGKGVIHRDIKPTNVLVTLHEGVPVPKVIDFGIAKATGQPLTDKTLFTNFAQMVGTPLYMSPEQAEMTGVDVDTRSDVYSLGVLLYELLTGTTPVDRHRMDRAAFDEVRRIIREENPPRPSTRLSTMDEQARSLLAARRRSDPRRLGQLVRGELDWIVMKALEKDRERRYETAHGLGLDVQRYLAHEPVRACPPSAVYRARTFVRRHRGAVLAAAIVLVTLAGGIVGTTMGLLRAERARQGESDRAEGERRAKERAEANLALARESVETYLGTVTNDPDLLQSDFHRLRKRLLEGALPFFERIAAQTSDDPAIEASRGRAHLRLALVHLTLGDFAAARADAESMVAIFTRLATTSPTVPAYRHGLANGLHNLAAALTRLGKFEDAEPAYRQALRIYEALVAERPREPEFAYEHAVCQNDLGVLLHDLGRHEDAEAAYARALDLHTQVAAAFPGHAENRGRLAGSLHNLGSLRTSVGRYAEAEAAFRQALPVQESLAREFPGNPTYRRTLAQHHHSLGDVLLHQGSLRDAEAAYHQAVTLSEQLAADFGTVPDYRHAIGQGYCNLGVTRVRMAKYPEAEEALRQALTIQAKLAAEFRRVPEYQAVQAAILNNLGNVLLEQGKLREGEDVLRDSLRIQEALVADHPGVPEYALDLGGNYCNLGQLLRDSGQPDASIPWFEKAIARLQAEATREPRLVTAQEFLRNSHRGKADALDALGRHAEAIESHEKALAFARQLNGAGHPGTIAQAYDLIDRYDALGRHADALRLREELLTVRQTTLGPDDPETLGAMANLANGYANLGREADALQLRERTLTLMRARIPDHPYLLITLEACAVDLLRLGRGAEAVPLLDECVRRAEGQPAQADLLHRVIGFRLRHFEGQRAPSGCRETAEMWERQGRTDADSLYDAACYRAVTAAVLRAADPGEEAARAAEAEADRAVGWLRKALAVGFSDLAHLEKDEDLAALHDRADFQELVTLWKQRVR